MEIKNIKYNYKNITFKNAVSSDTVKLGEEIVNNIRNVPKLEDLVKGETPAYLKIAGKGIRKLAPFVEEKFLKKKPEIEDLVNLGNIAKELVCMIVYPLQVLTNPDLPKDKRRFVGLYDFFVTCFSLGGTVLFAWKGKKLINGFVENVLMKKYKNNPIYPKAKRAIEGGGFVLGIAIQTILFKRVLAPAFAPPLAAAVRKKMEANDAKKGKSEDNKDSSTLIPPEHDAALSVAKENKDKHQ